MGVAFLEALSAARADQDSGPVKLSFLAMLPFDEGNMILFLRQHELELLALASINFDSEAICRALAAADVRCLELDRCFLVDGGAALVEESARAGRGPKGLVSCFHLTQEKGSSPSRMHCEEIFISGDLVFGAFIIVVASSLKHWLLPCLKRGTYIHLSLIQSWMSESCWNELLTAISVHPSLRELEFDILPVNLAYGSIERTKILADMLLLNGNIEDIPFSRSAFDRAHWGVLVAPKLEYNLYRKRFLAIQKIGLPSSHAAVVGKALAHFQRKPSLVWMFLSQNRDILHMYRNSTSTSDH
jgi:hypothetical protein